MSTVPNETFPGLTSACEKASVTMARAVRRFAACALSTRVLGLALRKFGEVAYLAAGNGYTSAHNGHLPGSTRTARLRKKRRDAVLRWWREQ